MLASGAYLKRLAEEGGRDEGAVHIGYHALHALPVHVAIVDSIEVIGLPGVVEGEIYCVIEMPEYVNVIEPHLQVDAMTE